MRKIGVLLLGLLLLAGCAAAEDGLEQAVAYSYLGDAALLVDGVEAASHSADTWQRGLIKLPAGGALTFTGQVERITPVGGAEAEAILAAGQDMGVYAISVTDESGQPLAGAMVQVCDAASCRLERTDESGLVLLTLPRFAYEVHMLRAPQGYQLPEEAILMPEEGGHWAIPLKKAN